MAKVRVILKKMKDRKIRNFYPFVYKDEVKSIMGNYENGDIVDVVSEDLSFVGRGYINDNASTLVRVLTTQDEKIDKKFIKNRIKTAYENRKHILNETNSIRLFYSEADGFSGLIVDMFGKYLSVQFRTLGIEKFKEEIIKSLREVIKPKGIYERSDMGSRIKEGLELKSGLIYGEIPDEIIMEDNGMKFIIDIVNGQKTGFFLDQRDSRKFIMNYIKPNSKVLDVFSSSGGFSMAALKKGSKKVVAIDKSPEALEVAKKNYSLNEFEGDFSTIEGDAFSILNILSQKKEKYDLIVLDPPALVKSKNDVKKGRDLFYNLCDNGFKLIEKDGILGVCTCAYHITLQDLIEVTRMAASKNGKLLKVVGVTYQPEDHPWILHIPESLYLKCLWVKVMN
ncbi:class I SAM-dependent rRNA methyltransferase [Haliovirga abyssi]|uniref:Methyltransferase n=1 Tax=Haliovirga abyssi TaxID=2996794 RepID=A0AAU9DJ24_9FUSO|nr:class I SAM-dependent rRNA methyltransferase [Haliovirga abyssi]BDU50774.1 methyltransferase [Haliovirga abyssi]